MGAEGGQVDGDQGGDPGFAASPADDQPSLSGWCGGWVLAARVSLVQGDLLIGHVQGEQGGQDHAPGVPRLPTKLPPEQVGRLITARMDTGGGSRRSGVVTWGSTRT